MAIIANEIVAEELTQRKIASTDVTPNLVTVKSRNMINRKLCLQTRFI